jgi:hypothetical protein
LTYARTPTRSRKKSREVELDTLITRTRKLGSAKFAALHVRPHVSLALPRVNVPKLVPSGPVAFAAVQVVPPFQESCTHIFGAPDVLSAPGVHAHFDAGDRRTARDGETVVEEPVPILPCAGA